MARVLLVEPDRPLANIYIEALQHVGHTVDHATNSQSAINLADDNQPDVAVIELQLIEHSGIEFLYEFRSYPDWQTIPVILHTSVPAIEFSHNWQTLCDQLGVSTYQYKPSTSLDDLLLEVGALTNLSISE